MEQVDKHVVFLTGYIPPYALPVFQSLHQKIRKLTILVSTPMESDRQWEAEFGDLDVRIQSTLTKESTWRHSIGFRSKKETHMPWDTCKQLKSLQPDVIISEELGFRSLFCSWYQLWRPSTPLIFVCNLSEHTERGRGFARTILRRWLCSRATLLTFNGLSGRRYLRGCGVSENRLLPFPYTAVPGLFDQLDISRRAPKHRTLIYCGELSVRKGIMLFLNQLVKWCEANRDRQISFRLIGKGKLQEELTKVRLPSNLVVELLGYRNYDEVASEMSRASLMVFPTLADEWGLVVNESLAAGLPVLGSIYSQAVEELLDSGNGWTFDPTNEADTQRAIDSTMQCSEDDLSSMRANCRASVSERTPAWAADKMVSAIRVALNGIQSK